MEHFSCSYPASQRRRGRTLVGCVGSGDLEVLLEPASADFTLKVTTSVNGSEPRWRALFDRLFAARDDLPALTLDIHDFGATPGVVRLRLEQGLETLELEEAAHV
ncbi:malonate decarboxylase subunit delta [Pseudomonas oryzihabitans]|uniref:malonate decarboxylase subunit delta n=1 Tax=Pseudomonas oryzihabitans TaxID=47885 RepID=UPI00111D686B|nr:malonate decarboxylase subunit delta [Pseudomonas psychrotolerans]QDD88473.1 malonate decarboxylase acyl carrier protein [Pseudomonas psychrotolerans]